MVGHHLCVCSSGDCAAPRCLSPLGDHSWPPDQPFCWGPLSLPSEDPLLGLVPKALFKCCLCFIFFPECRTASWFPRLGILRLGSGLCSTAPSYVSAEIPRALQPPRGLGWGVEVGRDPTPGSWPEPRAARHLGPGSASGPPARCAGGEPGWACGVRVPGKDPEGGCRVPRKQPALQLRPLTRSLHFFSKWKFNL